MRKVVSYKQAREIIISHAEEYDIPLTQAQEQVRDGGLLLRDGSKLTRLGFEYYLITYP